MRRRAKGRFCDLSPLHPIQPLITFSDFGHDDVTTAATFSKQETISKTLILTAASYISAVHHASLDLASLTPGLLTAPLVRCEIECLL